MQRVNRCTGRSENRRCSTTRPYRRSCHTLLVLIPPCCSPAVAVPAGVLAKCSATAADLLLPPSARRAVPMASRPRSRSRAWRDSWSLRSSSVTADPRQVCLPRTWSVGWASTTSMWSPGRPPAPVGCAGAVTTRQRPSPRPLLANWGFRAAGCCIEPTVRLKPENRAPTVSLVQRSGLDVRALASWCCSSTMSSRPARHCERRPKPCTRQVSPRSSSPPQPAPSCDTRVRREGLAYRDRRCEPWRCQGQCRPRR